MPSPSEGMTVICCIKCATFFPLIFPEQMTGVQIDMLVTAGSSIPSAFLLWMMRELPAPLVINREQESRIIAFISDSSVTVHPQRWTTTASLQNQVSTSLFSFANFCDAIDVLDE